MANERSSLSTSSANDGGYVLAATLASLFAMSLLAAALVTFSGDALSRTRRVEIETRQKFHLESAILLAATQISQDPRRRRLAFINSEETVQLGGDRIDLRVSNEAQRIDANASELSVIAETFRSAGASPMTASEIVAVLQTVRHRGGIVQVFDVLGLSPKALACATEVLTPFGGRTETSGSSFVLPGALGQATPGDRIRIDARTHGSAKTGMTAVILVTNRIDQPPEFLDWRRSLPIGPDACRDAQP